MFNKIVHFTIFSVSIIAGLYCSTLFAQEEKQETVSKQNNRSQVRDVELSTPEQRLTYAVIQDNTIEKFAEIEKLIIDLQDGNTRPIPTFSEHELDYLTAIYLFCSLQSGSCPLVLDALLEADLIYAAQNGSSECPALTQFWKLWVANSMERRFEHGLKVGAFNTADQFKRQERPKYIRCSDTVGKQLENAGPSQNFFRKRYSTSAKPLENISKTRGLLEEAKEKIPNIYARIGRRR